MAVDGLMGKPALPPSLQRFLPASYSHGSALGLAIGLLVALAILVNLQGLLGWWLQTYTGEKLVWNFRAQLLNHVQRLPLAFHDRYGASDSV
ncbi:MAG TPA: hypothetical protein VKG87_09650, partial [Terriglobales bacterium]|nr:hypothetical protein [Terriglobales bacterium]